LRRNAEAQLVKNEVEGEKKKERRGVPEKEEGEERWEGEERKEQWRRGERRVEELLRVTLRETEDGFGVVRIREAVRVGAFVAMQSDNEAIIHLFFFFTSL